MKKLHKFVIVLLALSAVCCLLALSACSKKNTGYTVSFDVAGGSALKTVVSSEEFELPTPERDGHTFAGWYDSADYSGEKLGAKYKPAENVTLYAKWLPFILELSPNGYTVVSCASESGEVEVPSEFDGVAVTAIGNGAFANGKAATIKLPSSVNKIYASAFINCGSLKSIELPDAVTEIGVSAFSGCAALETVKLSAKTEIIGGSAFSGCKALNTINIPAGKVSVGRDAFKDCVALVKTEGGVSYVNTSVIGCDKDAVSVTLRSGTTGVLNYAFENCEKLSSVTFSDNNLTFIGDSVFSGCKALNSVNLPTSVSAIGDAAFYGCEELTAITVPAKVTQIKSYAFYNCKKLSSVTFEGQITSIEYGAFGNCAALTSVALPDSVEYIGSAAFKGCYALGGKLDLPASLKRVDSEAFRATALTEVNVLSGVESIGNGAFGECENLVSVTFQNGVERIGYGAFENCAGITEVVLPDSVKTVEERAFAGCSALKTVTLGKSLSALGANAFGADSDKCPITRVNYAGTIEEWCAISFAPDSNPVTISHNLYIDNVPVTEIELFNNVSDGEEPSDKITVTEISDYAFDGLTGLTRVCLGSNVTKIGDNAFRGTSVEATYFAGSSFEWLVIAQGEGNDLLGETVRYYSETEPIEGDTLKYWHYVGGVITEW